MKFAAHVLMVEGPSYEFVIIAHLKSNAVPDERYENRCKRQNASVNHLTNRAFSELSRLTIFFLFAPEMRVFSAVNTQSHYSHNYDEDH